MRSARRGLLVVLRPNDSQRTGTHLGKSRSSNPTLSHREAFLKTTESALPYLYRGYCTPNGSAARPIPDRVSGHPTTTISSSPPGGPGSVAASVAAVPPATTTEDAALRLRKQANENAQDDSPLQEPELIFKKVWDTLQEKLGRENLNFPKETIFLMGAPGAGKGTNTPFILRERGITAPPIVMSDLLTSPEAEEIKRKAGLVSDFVVVALLFEKLLEPVYQNGVIVDGFPRTPAQVGVIKLLHDQMKLLRKEFADTEHSHKFRRPVFRVTVLYVDEQLSVERQLARGVLVRQHNEEVRRTGWGKLMEERATDFEPEAARQRYSIFANHYDTLKTLQKLFQFNIIPAGGTISDVEKAIKREFAYQSQYELGEETFDAIQKLPTAYEITAHSRQRLIRRLDTYSVKNPAVFAQVIRVLNDEFYPIISAHSLSGECVVRSMNKIFNEPISIPMTLDILSERGFYVVADVKKTKVPLRFERRSGSTQNGGDIWEPVFTEDRVLIFRIYYKRPIIRRDEAAPS